MNTTTGTFDVLAVPGRVGETIHVEPSDAQAWLNRTEGGEQVVLLFRVSARNATVAHTIAVRSAMQAGLL